MAMEKPGMIGKAIRIKGELHGEEDLVIEGTIEGTVTLAKHHLRIERSGVVQGSIDVDAATIRGTVTGNTKAAQRLELTAEAKVTGDIDTPRLVMADGARFRGTLKMNVELPKE